MARPAFDKRAAFDPVRPSPDCPDDDGKGDPVHRRDSVSGQSIVLASSRLSHSATSVTIAPDNR